MAKTNGVETLFCRVSAVLILTLLVLACSFQRGIASETTLRASAYKMSGTTTQTRVDIEFSRDPTISWFLLRAPYRLVIDLPKTKFALDPRSLDAAGLVSNVRYGDMGDDRSRLILTAKKPFKLQKLDVVPRDDSSVVSISIDLKSATQAEFDTALSEQLAITSSTIALAKAPVAVQDTMPSKKFTVVLDPGHGGVDGGAKSEAGTVEKEITLAFGLELKKKLEETGRYTVLLTRDSDVFVPLSDRVTFARQHGGQLFISIHADTIRVKGLRGATVYTVSDEASDADAAALADRENLADEIGGIEIKDESQEVADILVDLIRRETHGFSVAFARTLLSELSDAVKLINNPHRHARFRVLRAPDVPSVLVELGYLSNAKDEAQLTNAEWRGKIADSVVDAVNAFAGNNLRAGG